MSRTLLALLAGLVLTSAACGQSAENAKVGLEKRVPWTTSRITGSPQPPAPYVSERVFPSLTFNEPVELIPIPGTNRLAMIEVKGTIYTFENKPDATDLKREMFAELTQLDSGFYRVYGMTFHPRFAENRYCYVSYVLRSGIPDGSRVSRFKVTDTNPPTLDLASEQIIITWMSGGHNGAALQFGRDGCLYVSTGDGGESFPPDGRNTGQDLSDLLAAILRIDVDHPAPGQQYRIPADNPFVKTANARGEIWAYGVRNPWKMCFDPADGSLWVGDVGWEMWEMIYRIERGGNYGWSIVEGSQPVHSERQTGPTPILPPTVEHDHTEARSITGGYFSQSPRLPDLKGAYVYGDYVTGKVWGLKHDGGKITWLKELVDTPLQIVTFGLDQQGEVLLVDFAGTIHRLVPNPRQGANADFPKKLSETGLFASVAKHQPAPGVIPYSVNAEPWADGTTAERLVALPGETKLGTFKKTDVQIGYITGDFSFPDGGVLAKTVSIELAPGNPASRRRLETQVLHYDVDTWKAYNYLWNDEQTDAVLAGDEGTNRTFSLSDPAAPGGKRTQTWRHASRTECILCHTTRAGSIHSFKPEQLDRDHNYDGLRANQLRTLDHIGLFAEPLPTGKKAWPDPYDAHATLDLRAKAYLHVNCGHCHRRGGGGSAAFDVQFDIPLDKARLVGGRPTQGAFGIHDAQLVAPGDPYRSVLYYRMMKLGHGRMPQFGSQVIDSRGTQLIHDWIAALPTSDAVELASVAKVRKQEQAALDKLLSGGEKAAAETVKQLLASPGGALRLATSLSGGKLPEPVKKVAIDTGTHEQNAVVRDLFERYVPEEGRLKRLGTAIKPAEILSLRGDASRGRTFFFEAAGVQCRNCHKIGEQGKAVGPDLTAIGKKHPAPKLLETILEPSKTIEPQFLSYMVETAEGQVISGLLVRRTDQEVVLRQADGKEIRIAADNIERFAPQQKSLMPDLLLQEMTAQQVADLLAYLSSLQ